MTVTILLIVIIVLVTINIVVNLTKKSKHSSDNGLKNELSNVKMDGIHEIQLSELLEQFLAPVQYEANVRIKANSSYLVEFAIKLPERDHSGKNVWLPINSKFTVDIYDKIVGIPEEGNSIGILFKQVNFDNIIKKEANNIIDYYVDPPNTTDFGIMFLDEFLYLQVVEKAVLLEDLQRDFKIIVTSPKTLTAILNRLQMGFKTLAIQKRSDEVWQIIDDVKKEFINLKKLSIK